MTQSSKPSIEPPPGTEWDRGTQGVINRLVEASAEVELHGRRLKGARRRRNQLVAKLRHAGLSLRQIESVAGISNARISQVEHK